MAHDLRYALRALRRSPGFTFTALVVLTLALTANATFFTLYQNYALQPIPIRAPHRNYDFTAVSTEGRRNNNWSPDEFAQLQAAARDTFEGLYAEATFQLQTATPRPGSAYATSIAGPYFDLLSPHPAALGRFLTPRDAQQPVIVLSDAGWRRLFLADPQVLGRTLRVRATTFTVVGVAPSQFLGTQAVVPDFWVPADFRPALRADYESANYGLDVFGILRSSVSPIHAAAALQPLALSFPREIQRKLARLELHLRDSLIPHDEQTQVASAFLFAAFLLVLLIACANLANLHLARAAARSQEIAIRLSLGASRFRLIRQLLTESVLLALIAAAFSLVLTASSLSALQRYLFSPVLSTGLTLAPLSLNLPIFLFTALAGLLAGIAFGLFPALEATSPNLATSAKRGSFFAGLLRPQQLRGLLITAQAAASVLLLITAGTLVRNTQRLYTAHPGFDLDRLVNTRIEKPTRADVQRLAQHPAVETASVMARVPLSGWVQNSKFLVNGRSESLFFNYTDQNFLALFDLPLLEGRNFTPQEADRQAPVAIISQATARRLFPRQTTALGQTLQLVLDDEGRTRTYEIIGVVPDIMSGLFFQGLDRSAVYLPTAPGQAEASDLLIRTRPGASAAATIAALRNANPEIDPIPARLIADMQRFPFQAAAATAGLLGVLALLLTSIGLSGVVSYLVSQRTRELGIRIALGATPARIGADVLTGAARQLLTGILLALPACYALSRLATANILNFRTFEPIVYLATPLLLIAIALGGCFLPARRAARTDPMVSLRQD